MQWYSRVRFRCPECGAKLAVEAGQVRRRETVTCIRCNTDLLLVPQGERQAPATEDRLTGRRHAPRDAVLVELETG